MIGFLYRIYNLTAASEFTVYIQDLPAEETINFKMERESDKENLQLSPRSEGSSSSADQGHSLPLHPAQTTPTTPWSSFLPYCASATSHDTSSTPATNQLNNYSAKMTHSPLPFGYFGPFGSGYGMQQLSFKDTTAQRLPVSVQGSFPAPVQGHTSPPNQPRRHSTSPTSKTTQRPKFQDDRHSSDDEEDGNSLENGGDQFKQLYKMGNEPDRKALLDELFEFQQSIGTPINKVPTMDKKMLDLYKLFKLVVEKGGVYKVITKKLWRDVTKGLKLSQTITSAAFTLRSQYLRYLYPLECKKYKLSTMAEVTAAIESNKRDGRRNAIMADFATASLPLAMLPQAQFNLPLPMLARMMSNANQVGYPFGYPLPHTPLHIGAPAGLGMPPVAASTTSTIPSLRVGSRAYNHTGNQTESATGPVNPKRLAPDGELPSDQNQMQTPKRMKSSNGPPAVNGEQSSQVRVSDVMDTREGMFVTMWRDGLSYSGYVYPSPTDKRV